MAVTSPLHGFQPARPRAGRWGSQLGRVHAAVLAASIGLSLLAVGLAMLFLLGRADKSVDAPNFRIDPPADDDASFQTPAHFQFTDQHGQPFGSEQLAGQPWVLAAIFTTCGGPCPKIVRGLQSIEDRLADAGTRIVCLSVDPEYDTVEVLARFAERFETSERWTFLTGDEKEIHQLLISDFLMGTARDDKARFGEHVTHQTKVVALDRDGVIRGWYSGVDEPGLERLAARMEFLGSEPTNLH